MQKQKQIMDDDEDDETDECMQTRNEGKKSNKKNSLKKIILKTISIPNHQHGFFLCCITAIKGPKLMMRGCLLFCIIYIIFSLFFFLSRLHATCPFKCINLMKELNAYTSTHLIAYLK